MLSPRCFCQAKKANEFFFFFFPKRSESHIYIKALKKTKKAEEQLGWIMIDDDPNLVNVTDSAWEQLVSGLALGSLIFKWQFLLFLSGFYTDVVHQDRIKLVNLACCIFARIRV